MQDDHKTKEQLMIELDELRQRLVESEKDKAERKQAEEALRGSEAKYRAVIENMEDVFYRTDKEGNLVLLSPSAARLVGVDSVEQIYGMNVAKEFYAIPEERDRFLQVLEAKGAVTDYNVTLKRPGGSLMFVSANSHVYRDANGEPLGVEGVFRDITERVRAEQKLRKNHQLSARAEEVGNFGYWNRDFEKNTGTWSQGCYRIFGINPDEFQDSYEYFLNLVHPADRESVKNAVDAALSSRQAFDLEYRIIRPDGKERVIRAAAEASFDESGQAVGLFGTTHDITERKQAEDTLRESEQRYKHVSDMIADFAYSCIKPAGGEFVIDWLVGAVEKITGYSIEEIQSHGCWGFFVHPLDLPIFEKNVIGIGPGDASECQLKIVCKDGSTRWIRASSRIVEDSRNPLSHRLFGSCEDITERKQAEEALEESEEKYRVLFEGSPHGILAGDIQTKRFAFANPSICQMLGYTEKELLQLSIEHIHPGDSLNSILSEYESQVRGEKKLSSALPCLRKDGTVFFADVAGTLTTIQGRKYAVGFFTDVTEPKRMENLLKESEEHYRLIAENIQDVFWMATPGIEKMLYISPAYEKIWGRSRESLYESPRSWIDAIHPQDRECVLNTVAQHRSQGTASKVVYRIIRPDGIERWVEDRGFPVFDENGNCRLNTGIVTDITERQRAEDALRKSEAQKTTILNGITTNIAFVDKDLRILWVNRAAAESVNKLPEEMMGHTCHAFWADSAKPCENCPTLKAFQTRKSEHTNIHTPDGRVWDEGGEPVFDAEGNVIGVVEIAEDITERVQQEREIRLLNRLYSVISQVSQAVVQVTTQEAFLIETCRVVVEKGGFVLSWIGQVEAETNAVVPVATWGETSDYVRGITVYADDRPEGRGPTGTCVRERRPSVHNDFLHSPLTQPWRQRAQPFGIRAAAAFPIESGGLVWGALTIYSDEVGFFGEKDVELLEKVAGDIGFALENFEKERQRKRAEDALWESQELLQAIIEAAQDSIFVKDTSLRYVQVNAAMESLLNKSREELVGHTDADLFGAEFAGPIEEVDRRVLQGEIIEDFPCKPSLGTMRHFHTIKVPLFEADGRTKGVCGIARDITAVKKAEEDRRKLEDRLRRAEKMESLGTLAGGVAHDLNNVLGIVVGYSELLLDESAESSSARSKAMAILKGGQRAAAIVQDLLTLARRGIPSRKVLNLNNVVKECQQSPEFTQLLSYHPHIQIKTDFEADLLNLSGSSVHLGKSLFNLVSNAAEAMPKGGNISIKTRNHYLDKVVWGYDEVREGDYVVLSVSDTGEGIPSSDLKRIFEPFYTKKMMGRRSGTGLGLAVVWGTVKDHHGYINVESEEGKGTAFTLYFPVTRGELSPEEIAASASEYMGNDESVLIVDDVKEQRELATTMLTKLNYKVSSVSSGEEAVEYLKKHAVDLVVLDMIMDPGMDGLDTYAKILEIHPHQKAIIVSGFSVTERVTKAQEMGAGPYVRKPYVLEKLGLAARKEFERSA